MQERAIRLVLASTEPKLDEKQYLDAHVLDCVDCYRDLLIEVAGQYSSTNTVLFGSRETSVQTLHDDLELTLRMAADNEAKPPL
jgi:hypothetical protein